MSHELLIRSHLSEFAKLSNHPLNGSITVPFPSWRVADIASARRLINDFCRRITFQAYGRSNQLECDRSKWLPFIGIPEHKTATRQDTFLHYHCVIHFPEEKWCNLAQFTCEYWRNKSIKDHDKMIYTNVSWGYDPARLIKFYNTKNLDEEFTIQNAVIAGQFSK